MNVNPEREHAFQPALPVKGEQNVWGSKQKTPRWPCRRHKRGALDDKRSLPSI
jgi:hypothetical protein